MKKIITMVCISVIVFCGCKEKENVYNEDSLSKVNSRDYNYYVKGYNSISDNISKALKDYDMAFGLESLPELNNKNVDFYLDNNQSKEFLKTIEFEDSIQDKSIKIYTLYDTLRKSTINIWNSYISSFEYYSNEKNEFNNSRYLHNDFIKNYNIFMYDYDEFYRELERISKEEKYKELDFLKANNFHVHYEITKLIIFSEDLLNEYLKNDVVNIKLDTIKEIEKKIEKQIKKINNLKKKKLVNYGLTVEDINHIEDFKIYTKRLYLLISEMQNIVYYEQSEDYKNDVDNSSYDYNIIKYENILKLMISSYNNI